MALVINNRLHTNKAGVLLYFRQRGEEYLQTVNTDYANNQYKERATEINHNIVFVKESLIKTILQKAREELWTNDIILNTVLLVTYASYVVMIDLRNSVWAYDYMSFSRRVGEIWEPFCKLAFEYPIRALELYVPPLFADIKKKMTDEIENYIDELSISPEQKIELKAYYHKVWAMVTSGEIQLELDLHFIQEGQKYNVDFKSGFGSNEKGNTNRLLLVATIYKNLEENHHCLLFVRADEDSNNQYFITLRDSTVWTATCGEATYGEILRFTGFDLKSWVLTNINWEADLLPTTVTHLRNNELIKYLSW